MNFLDLRLPQRFWDKTTPEPNSGCWLWLGFVNPKGYAILKNRRGSQMAHRTAYEALVGAIPDDLVIDHLCRQRCCVNPSHMEPVTSAENTRRGASGHNWRAKTHCPHGHPYSDGNLYRDRRANEGKGARRCRTCRIERDRERRQERSAE